PTGIAVEPGTGNVLVVDSLADSVSVFSPAGRPLRTLGRPGDFNRPTGIACDGKGRAYVTDTMNFRVRIHRISDGAFVGTFGKLGDGSGAVRDPRGVGVDGHGHVYLVDRAFSNVQVFDAKGRFLLAFGEPGRGPGQFDMPSDIFIGGDDTIYVTDSFNGRVQVFRYVGHEN
ncbi:MAG: 6-bladed beta-propeller, partial [Planctomycetota bacterium]